MTCARDNITATYMNGAVVWNINDIPRLHLLGVPVGAQCSVSSVSFRILQQDPSDTHVGGVFCRLRTGADPTAMTTVRTSPTTAAADFPGYSSALDFGDPWGVATMTEFTFTPYISPTAQTLWFEIVPTEPDNGWFASLDIYTISGDGGYEDISYWQSSFGAAYSEKNDILEFDLNGEGHLLYIQNRGFRFPYLGWQ